jgi:DNA-binding response OmpR family regulator
VTSPAAAAGASPLPPIVLLVEDDPDTREMYSTYFESEGVWIATAATPDEGLGAVEELRPDVVVTNIGFHGRPQGVDFVHLLKERADTRHIPLIVLTGLPVSDVPETVRHDADIFLHKPVPTDVLLLNVRQLLESSHALRARGERARSRVAELLNKSADLLQRSRANAAHPEPRQGAPDPRVP